MEKPVTIQKAADQLGLHPDTLRKWDREGRIVAVRTPGGHRRYLQSQIKALLGQGKQEEHEKNRVAVYCRVSSHDQKQKGDLERQAGRVLSYCVTKKYQVVQVFEEVGSGMSDERSKLKRLFKLIESGHIDCVVVEHKDRLCRFMFQFLVDYFASHGVQIEWVDEVLGKSYEEELVEDILSLMSSFSAKIYGKRSAENRKRKKAQGVVS
jgi:putative resolvase